MSKKYKHTFKCDNCNDNPCVLTVVYDFDINMPRSCPFHNDQDWKHVDTVLDLD